MNTRTKTILMAGTLAAAVSGVSALAADQDKSASVTVHGRRATEDQIINSAVVDKIASDPGITGNIGVETRRAEVTLTGLVSTTAQADRAESDARSVDGVQDVHDYVRARVGDY
jgi:osmotically-inducible protein OsmY